MRGRKLLTPSRIDTRLALELIIPCEGTETLIQPVPTAVKPRIRADNSPRGDGNEKVLIFVICLVEELELIIPREGTETVHLQNYRYHLIIRTDNSP